MGKFLGLLFLTLFSLTASAQTVTWGNSTINSRTEWFLPNSPTNNDGNRFVIGWIKGTSIFRMGTDTIRFTSLAGTGERFVFVKPDGTLVAKTYTFSTDSSVFATKYFTNSTYQPKGIYLSPLDTVNKWRGINWTPSWGDITGKPTIPTDIDQLTDQYGLLFNGDYNALYNKPNLGLYVKFSDTASMLDNYYTKTQTESLIPVPQTLSISGQTLSISEGNSVTLPITPLVFSSPSRTLNTNFTISNNTFVTYSLKILNGTALVSATSASVFLEYSSDGGTTWTTVSTISREENGLSLLNINTKGGIQVLSGMIPAGCIVRIRTSIQSGSSVELISVQEVKM